MTLKNACESNRKYDIFSNYQLVSYFGIFASTFTFTENECTIKGMEIVAL